VAELGDEGPGSGLAATVLNFDVQRVVDEVCLMASGVASAAGAAASRAGRPRDDGAGDLTGPVDARTQDMPRVPAPRQAWIHRAGDRETKAARRNWGRAFAPASAASGR